MSDAKIAVSAVDQTAAAFQSIKAAMTDLQGGAKQLSSHFGGLQAAVGALAGSLGVLAFGSMVKDVIGAGAALADLSVTTGATVEALSGLVAIGKLSGTGADQIGNAMTKLAKNMAAAGDEGKGAGRAIAALGLDFNSFIELRPEEQMLALAKAMNDFADGNGKAAVAQALWGKEGAKNLVFMHDLAVAGDIQAKMTTAQAEESKKLQDNWVRVRASGEAWKKELVGGMTPALNVAFQAVVDVTNGSGGLRDMMKKLRDDGTINDWTRMAVLGLSYVVDGAVYTKRAFQSIGEFIVASVTSSVEFFGSVGEAMKQALRFDFSGAIATTKSAVDVQKSIWKGLGQSMSDVWGAPTLGAQLRDRMKDLDNVGATAAKVRDQVNFKTPPKDGGKEAVDPFAAVLSSISESTAALKLEMEAGDKLTERQKASIKILDDVRTGKLQLTEASAALLGKVLEENLGMERNVGVNEAAKKAAEELTKAAGAMIKSLQDQIDAQVQHNDEIGLSKDAIAALIAKKTELSAAADNEMADNLRAAADYAGPLHDAYIQYAKDLDDAAAKKRGLAELKVTGAAKEMMVDEAKRAADEWKKTNEEINRTLTDALMNAFESGVGFGKAFVKTIEDMFKTMVLRPVIAAIVSPISSSINSAIGMSNPANVASMGAGVGSWLGAGASALGTFGSAAGSTALGLYGGIGELSSLGFGEALTGSISAIMEGSLAAGFGTLAGVLGPIGIGIAAISMLLSGHGETRSGGQYNMGTLIDNPSGGEIGNASQASAITVATINATLKAIGSSSQLTNLFTGVESSKNGKGFAYAGGTLSNGAQFGQGWGTGFDGTANLGYMTNRGSMTQEEAMAKFGTELKQATLQALQAATDVPDSIMALIKGKNFDKMTDTELDPVLTAVNNVITGVAQFRGAITQLPFDKLTGQSFDFAASLGELSGGMDKYLANLSGYFQNYFSADEQRLQAAKNIQAVLHAAGADFSVDQILNSSRAAFRQVVESYEGKTDAASQAIYAALLSVQGVFAAITPAATEAAAAIDTVNGTLRTAADIGRERYGLETQLLQLQGNTVALRERELATLDESNRAIQQQIWALEDSQAAQQALAKTDTYIYQNVGDIATAAASAASAAADQWRHTAQTIQEVMAQLRGDLVGTGGAQDYAQAQSQFTIATAKARAGDQTAADSLPGLAKLVQQLGRGRAVSAFDANVNTAGLLASLDRTLKTIPSYDVGTPYVPRTGLALVHQGETITPAGQSSSAEANRQAEARAMVSQLADIRKFLQQLTEQGVFVLPSPGGEAITTAAA